MLRWLLLNKSMIQRQCSVYFRLTLLSTFVFFGMTGQTSAMDTPATEPVQLSIMRITPAETWAPESKQIVIEFNKPVVSLGQMGRDSQDIAIEISPPINCSWRWISRSALSCQLREVDTLKLSTRYTVLVPKVFSKLEKSTLQKEFSHSFTTRLPNITYGFFKEWSGPTRPVVSLYFDQGVKQESVAQHLYFLVNNVERVPAEISPTEKNNDGTSFLATPVRDLEFASKVSVSVEPGIEPRIGEIPSLQNKEIVSFQTYNQVPSFQGITCTGNFRESITILPGQEPLPYQRCDPRSSIYLTFNTPVTASEISKTFATIPSIPALTQVSKPQLPEPSMQESESKNIWEDLYNEGSNTSPHAEGRTYRVAMPMVFKANSSYEVRADGYADIFGRKATGALVAKFTLDHRRPGYRIPTSFPVLEQGVETDAPAYITNLKELHVNYSALTADGSVINNSKSYTLPIVEDLTFAFPLKLRDFLGGRSGAVKGAIDFSPKPVRPTQQMTGEDSNEDGGDFESDEQRESHSALLLAQVTPFEVHFKLGYFNSLAWVTRLADGSPVPQASVELVTDHLGTFQMMSGALAQGTTDENGLASLPGVDKLNPSLDIVSRRYLYSLLGSGDGEGDNNSGVDTGRFFMVKVKLGDEVAFLPLLDNFEVNLWGGGNEYISDYLRERGAHLRAWGTTAQGIYRPGDTIQYKIYVRDTANLGFIAPPVGNYSLVVKDPLDNTVAKVDFRELSKFGGFSGEIPLAQSAVAGQYSFSLNFTPSNITPATASTLEVFSVLVSDFTPAPFKVTSEVKGEKFRPGDKMAVETTATLHSGGAYGKAPTKVTVSVQSLAIQPIDPALNGFTFTTASELGETIQGWSYSQEGVLGDSGELESQFDITESPISHGQLDIESLVRDDRGAYFAARTSARYNSKDRFVGLRQIDWLLEVGKGSLIDLVVVNEDGNVVPGVPMEIEIEREEVTAARVKGPGNAFITEYNSEWKRDSTCSQVSAAEIVSCAFVPRTAGNYRFRATIVDTRDQQHQAEIQSWAMGAGYVLFNNEENTALDVKADKKTYKVGDKARFFIKNPYPGARALLTVERSGIIKRWTQKLETSTEIVEVVIEPDFIPGFFFGATVVSPRVEKPISNEGLDLGKPAFKTGYTTVNVDDRYKNLDVSVKLGKEVYRPGDEVSVDLSSSGKHGSNQPVEFAVAVLDEAVFGLLSKGKDTYDPYTGFYYPSESLEVINFNILRQLVGRIKFEKKGSNPGGSGGLADKLRLDFRYLAYWNPSLPADAGGQATFKFKLPESLTGWRVLAVAVTPTEYMGLGMGTFKVNRPTEIRPALPNSARVGDRFDAAFTVFNRTANTREITFALKVNDLLSGAESKLVLKPFDRQTVRMPVVAERSGIMKFTAKAHDNADSDAIEVSLPIKSTTHAESAFDYAVINETKRDIPVKLPDHSLATSGSLQVSLSPSIVTSIAPAIEYLRDYKYNCWEQRLSKALAAAAYLQLKTSLPRSLNWDTAESDLKNTLAQTANFQAPSGGMTYYNPRDQYVSPYLSIYTALAFEWFQDLGYAPPSTADSRLGDYLSRLLKSDAALGAEGELQGADTLRALAVRVLYKRGFANWDEATRLSDATQTMPIFAKSAFITTAAPNDINLARKVYRQIQNLGYESAGQLVMKSLENYNGAFFLSSGKRDACFMLNELVGLEPSIRSALQVTDEGLAKLARAIVNIPGTENRNPWKNTQEAGVCSMALLRYARALEGSKVPWQIESAFGSKPLGKVEFRSAADTPVTFTHSLADLAPGDSGTLSLTRKQGGRYYANTVLTFTPQSESEILSGLEVRREYSVEREGKWQLVTESSKLKLGDLVKIDLFIMAPADRSFVVVDDALPGALEPVNKDLATSGRTLAEPQLGFASESYWHKFKDWEESNACYYCRFGFYHRELKSDSVRYYSEALGAGRYHLSYTAQVVASGTFAVPALRAEEMYDPDVQARTGSQTLSVE